MAFKIIEIQLPRSKARRFGNRPKAWTFSYGPFETRLEAVAFARTIKGGLNSNRVQKLQIVEA